MVVSALMIISFMFMCVVVIVWTILMVKGVFKVFVGNWFHHVGRSCVGHFNICCFKVFKDLVHCDFKLNGELAFLWFAFKIDIVQ